MITKIENFLDQGQIRRLLDLVNELPERDGRGSAGDSIKTKKSSTVYDDVTWPGGGSLDGKQRRMIHDVVFDEMTSTADIVSRKVSCGEFINVYNSIGRYQEGDYYDWHLDRLTTGFGSTVDVAYTIFLNDQYDGGELEIKHEYGKSVFKEEPGTVVFYPTALMHRVCRVVSGERFVVLGMLDCLVSSPQHRYILSELSDCISLLDSVSESLANSMIDSTHLDNINQRLHYVEMQLEKRFIKS